MKRVCFVFLAIFCSVTRLAGAGRDGKIEPAAFVIPYTASAPTIDGRIDEDEWRHSVALTGGVYRTKAIEDRQCTYYLAWDEEFLYVAARSRILPGSVVKFGQAGAMNDCLELVFFPTGRDGDAPTGPGMVYQFFVSPDGADGFGRVNPSDRSRIRDEWNPEVVTADRIVRDPDNTYGPGTRLWEIELKVSRRAFFIPQANADGDEWRLVLCRNYSTPRGQIHLPISQGFFGPAGMLKGVLGKNSPFVKFEDVLNPLRGRCDTLLKIHNPATTPIEIDAVIDIARVAVDTAPSIASAGGRIAVPSGKTVDFALRGALPDFSPNDTANIRVAVKLRDRVIYSYSCDFRLSLDLIQADLDSAGGAVDVRINRELYSNFPEGIMTADGRGTVAKVTYVSGPHTLPRLAPDHSRVAFTSLTGGKKGVYVLPLFDGDAHRLADGEQAAFSPDGQRLAFTRNGELFTIGADGSNETSIAVPGVSDCAFPSWSPKGDSLLFTGVADGKRWVFTAHADGGELRRITVAEVTSPPSFSPDGTQIAFQDGAHIHVIDMQGVKRIVTAHGGVQSHPVWARNSRGIAYYHAPRPGAPGSIRAIDARGLGQSLLLKGKTDPAFDLDFNATGADTEIAENPLGFNRSDRTAVVSWANREIVTINGDDTMLASGIRRTRGVTFAEVTAPLTVGGKITALVIPDRIGNDIVVKKIDEGRTLDASFSPLVVGIVAGGKAVVVVIVPDEDRKIALHSPDGATLAVRIQSDKMAHVGVLAGPYPPATDGSAPWLPPFAATWRVTGGNRDGRASFMLDGRSIEVAEMLKTAASGGVPTVYPFLANHDTPLGVWTTSDIVYDACGIELGERVLKSDAATGKFVATGWTAYTTIEKTVESVKAAYTKRQAKWMPEDIANCARDVPELIAGMDTRIAEYADFMTTLSELLRNPPDGEGVSLSNLTEIAAGIGDEIKKSVEFTPVVTIAKIAQDVAEKGRPAADELERTALDANRHRKAVLDGLYALGVELRDRAARQVLHGDGNREIPAKVYALTEKLLSKRHYVEGDWRGEPVAKRYNVGWWEDVFNPENN